MKSCLARACSKSLFKSVASVVSLWQHSNPSSFSRKSFISMRATSLFCALFWRYRISTWNIEVLTMLQSQYGKAKEIYSRATKCLLQAAHVTYCRMLATSTSKFSWRCKPAMMFARYALVSLRETNICTWQNALDHDRTCRVHSCLCLSSFNTFKSIRSLTFPSPPSLVQLFIHAN